MFLITRRSRSNSILLCNLISIQRAHSHAGKEALVDGYYQPFQLNATEAKEKFLQWQKRDNWLSPTILLRSGSYELHPIMLPYWIFNMEASVKYTASIATAHTSNTDDTKNTNSNTDTSSLSWTDLGWKTLPKHRTFPSTQPQMQVYASYQFRQDFGDAMKKELDFSLMKKFSHSQLHSMHLSLSDASSYRNTKDAEQKIPLSPPSMRKALAWEFALRRAHEAEVRRCIHEVQTEYSTSHVKNMSVSISPFMRRCRLVYLPVYLVEYTHGEGFNVHGERHALKFYGLVSGLGNGYVAGEKHISIPKASIAGGAATVLAIGMLSLLSPMLGSDIWMWSSFDYIFSGLTASATAGLMAQMMPALHARSAAQKLAKAEVAYFEAANASQEQYSMNNSHGIDASDEKRDVHEHARHQMEWLRWEDSQKHEWNADTRHRWAERLWESQHARKKERKRHQQEAHHRRQRQQAEEMREQRRFARWGGSDGDGGGGGRYRYQNLFSGGEGAGGRVDYLGYYKALGFDVVGNSSRGGGGRHHQDHQDYGHHQQHHGTSSSGGGRHITQEEIKRAFRAAAMQWHPDKHADIGEKIKAREKFMLIRLAYETLRDPERRRKYDLGALD